MVIDLNYCPDWIFDVIAASVAAEFLRSPLSLVSISQRFSEGMKGAYNEIDVELLSTSSELISISSSLALGVPVATHGEKPNKGLSKDR